MPSRLIREGILTSERVEQLDPQAEVFYRRLLSKVDDFGLYDARPSILRASLYPLRIDRVREADCSRWIAACEKAGLIALYQHDGKPYMQVLDTNWQARSEPKYPLPPWGKGSPVRATENNCAQPQTPVPVFVFGDGDVDEDGAPDGADGFEGAWKAYPKRPGNSKVDALKAWKARVKEGHKPSSMADGVRRYAAYCRSSNTEPKFIKLAATFFGPGLHFQDEWKTEAESANTESVEDYQARMSAEREESRKGTTAPPAEIRELAAKLRIAR